MLVKAAGALGLLALAARAMSGIHLRAVFDAMLGVSPLALGLAVGTALVQGLVLVLRFQYIFPRDKRPSFGTAARAYAYSQSANVYLPARAGEVLRVVALTKGRNRRGEPSNVSVGDATSATLLDRVLDIAAFVIMALLFGKALLAGAVVGALSAWPFVLGAVVAVGLAALLVRRLRPAWFAKVRTAAAQARGAARSLLGPRRLAGGVGFGIASWLVELVTMLIIGAGLGLHVTAVQMMISLIVLNLGIALPITVANIGAYEAATVVGLTPFGVPATSAIAVGALHHAIQLLSVLGPALFLWIRDRFAARAVRRRAEVEVAPSGAMAVAS